MKSKLLSVTFASAIALTSFALLAVTASAASTVDLSTLTGDYEAQDGDILTGTLNGETQPYRITIADGATVTLQDVTINGYSTTDYVWAGITPWGDATIILEGTNTVKGFYYIYPGIYAAEGGVLTIQGDGSLTASSNGSGAGIGGGKGIDCGDIKILGGNITATGGDYAAGIGGGTDAYCGSIYIGGGIINAEGGDGGAGIGSGGSFNEETYQECGDITIAGGTVTATGGFQAAGIGAGEWGLCWGVVITDTVTRVTAKNEGTEECDCIGAGYGGNCAGVTIGGVDGYIEESPYTYVPMVKGMVEKVIAFEENPDGGATAFITRLVQEGDGYASVNSVAWKVSSPLKDDSRTFTKSDELPAISFNGNGAQVVIALAVNGLCDENAYADVFVR